MQTNLTIFSVVLYGLIAGWQGIGLLRNKMLPVRGWWSLGLIATICHAILLYHWIDINHAQNLTLVNLFSLVAWLVVVLVLLASLTKPISNLGIFVFPLAAISIVLAATFPGMALLNTATNPKALFHILLSTLAFSVLCIAALQAVLLAVQEWLLRHKHAVGIMQILPPLEIMETLLFQIIGLGFVLLSIVLITSVLLFHPLWVSPLWQKTLVSLFAWLVFAVLLIGRSYYGWRGRLAIRYTLVGVLVMMLAYYGSEFL